MSKEARLLSSFNVHLEAAKCIHQKPKAPEGKEDGIGKEWFILPTLAGA